MSGEWALFWICFPLLTKGNFLRESSIYSFECLLNINCPEVPALELLLWQMVARRQCSLMPLYGNLGNLSLREYHVSNWTELRWYITVERAWTNTQGLNLISSSPLFCTPNPKGIPSPAKGLCRGCWCTELSWPKGWRPAVGTPTPEAKEIRCLFKALPAQQIHHPSDPLGMVKL